MHRHYCAWLLYGLLMLLSTAIQAAEIQVAVDRNPVGLNESFQITFTASEDPDGNPDFAPLQENFEILSQQRSSNSSWVNGKSSRSEQWIVRAMAKQAGELFIPPIAFGADSSKPLKLVVNENTAAPQGNDDIFLEVAATPEQPYVQSQVLYTLKLFRKVQITQASLSEPEIKDALVEKLGEDSTYATQIKGVDYWVTERKYAIFPQQSGVFTIAPLILNAEYMSNQRQPRFNGFFNRPDTETRRVASKAITLNVQAVPASFKGPNWLSAESVTLSETWSDAGLQTKVGEPLTRTLTLNAKGATVGQLPELLDKTAIDGIKTYPDQPVLKEDKESDGLTALREEKIAFIPSKPGEYTLPALDIAWFNTKTQKMETAHLPSVKLKALASAENAQVPAPPAAATVAQEPATSQVTTSPITVTSSSDTRFWQAVSATLALGWLLTIVVWYRRPSAKVSTGKGVEQVPETAMEKTLKRACWENKPQAAKQALLQWGKAEFGAESLGAIAAHCAEALREEILALNRLLYSGRNQDWQGQALWQAFSAKPTAVSSDGKNGDGLEPLFKI
ncbi:BatD family protein [Methylomonas rosea]|uniref:BatD family protein n=1 Tax=Methylomonas rosea TaxID=2952227 RepID=A0ABT1TMF4_9GAMM|nr:BatD family protein [Methylomonas sp. WSC-7]MCQ8115948.1 BatD family protein [Methylomonas sp. WSC-7]